LHWRHRCSGDARPRLTGGIFHGAALTLALGVVSAALVGRAGAAPGAGCLTQILARARGFSLSSAGLGKVARQRVAFLYCDYVWNSECFNSLFIYHWMQFTVESMVKTTQHTASTTAD
jgi:hypothetical protein